MQQMEEDGSSHVRHMSASLNLLSCTTVELQKSGTSNYASIKTLVEGGPVPLYGNIRKLGRTWNKLSSLRIWKVRFMVIEDQSVTLRKTRNCPAISMIRCHYLQHYKKSLLSSYLFLFFSF
jgi:hypothetical protein